MLSLPEMIAVETALPTTKPFYLIEIGFDSPLRLSTGIPVPWNSQNWVAVGARMVAINEGVSGAQSATISLSNIDSSASSLVLNEGTEDRPITIWQLYGGGPFGVNDAVKIFNGVIDDVPSMTAERVTLNAVSTSSAFQLCPRVYFEHVCNHMPAAGAEFVWGGQRYILGEKNG